MPTNHQPVTVDELTDVHLKSICASLKKLKLEIYMVYGERSNSPSIHIVPSSFRGKTFERLVRYVGINNFASRDCQITMRPHNCGGWESYLSLEPVKTCSKEGLEDFALLMEMCARNC